MSETLEIEALGAQGDGIAQTPAGPVYVPFSLAGETVTVKVKGRRAVLESVTVSSPDRTEPACRHFGACGGCAVQHLEGKTYAAWKRAKIVHALQSRGIDAEVDPLVACPPASRRRVAFTARKVGRSAVLGFNAAQSHHVVPVSECPVAVPQITAALDALRDLAEAVAATPKPFRLLVTATRTGLDVAVEGAGRLGEKQRRRVVDIVLAKGFARLALDGAVLVERDKPVILFGDVPVAVPVGGFLQAVGAAEEAMAALVVQHLRGGKRVADLFAGSGTFALRLARDARVHAVESDRAALDTLDQAARHAQGLKPVTVERRDLFDRPLVARELDAFDGIVFDPPRAGAEAQCRQIARAKIGRMAAVSCNPGTLARDLSILVEGGYRITRVVPIDQFLWSPHVEVVALLEHG
ncbi:class I SAM-dependent RNA methyltransferase [Nitratireductor sp. GCM10026969]|uniref:class I SAM-dependent RNA methyltransferase n=1 Tax=Nitratireductor sp. GCM10026969 TaxID=3252645 RepID=UPI00360D32AE